MRRYETILLSDPDISEDMREALFTRTKEIISSHSGKLIEMDNWGVLNLAYEVRKKNKAHYMRVDYCGMPDTVSEIERAARIDDRVLKYMTVLMEENADPEKILQEMAESAQESEASSAETGEESAEEPQQADSGEEATEEEEEKSGQETETASSGTEEE